MSARNTSCQQGIHRTNNTAHCYLTKIMKVIYSASKVGVFKILDFGGDIPTTLVGILVFCC